MKKAAPFETASLIGICWYSFSTMPPAAVIFCAIIFLGLMPMQCNSMLVVLKRVRFRSVETPTVNCGDVLWWMDVLPGVPVGGDTDR